MPTIRNTVLPFARLAWNVILVEGALLVVITLLWRLTTWHINSDYGFALFTAGGIMVGVGLLGIARRGGSEDTKLVEAEMEMRSWDRRGQRRFISPYDESTRFFRWLIGLGLLTAAIGTIFNAFFA